MQIFKNKAGGDILPLRMQRLSDSRHDHTATMHIYICSSLCTVAAIRKVAKVMYGDEE